MTKTSFAQFMDELRPTNQTLDALCDFGKIARNTDEVRLSLCVLGSLVGAADLRAAVELI